MVMTLNPLLEDEAAEEVVVDSEENTRIAREIATGTASVDVHEAPVTETETATVPGVEAGLNMMIVAEREAVMHPRHERMVTMEGASVVDMDHPVPLPHLR